ncbi:hypothetical protein TASIC1_0004059700 [Trichoderma asperellum]|uniref:Uncharacterized protein n=1 Tax=Trichoderma asperellum TaxID=101201 RepID=A0A6V8QS64_TRIAP|nr:hypothetical protein TASIC1_0004059700 [Trichoderma asperellum]
MPRGEVPWGETNERFMITIQQLVVRGFATEHHASAAEPDLNMAALDPAFATNACAGTGWYVPLVGRLACILSNQRSKAARLKEPLAQLGLASRKSPKSQQMLGCA